MAITKLHIAVLLAAASLITGYGCSSDTCDEVSLESLAQEWDEAVEDAKACQVVEDCAVLALANCAAFSGCGVAVNGQEVEQLTALEESLVARQDRCDITCATPACAETPDASCVNNRCEIVQ